MSFRDEMEIAGVEVEHVLGLGWVRKGCRATVEYGAEYEHNGTKWGLDFFAEDDDDAVRKLESIRSSLSLLGRLDERIKVEV